MRDFYEIMEVSPDASFEQIKQQRRFLVNAWHPDKFSNPDQKVKAEARTKEINAAYEVLSDPTKRTQYDRERSLRNSQFTGDADIQRQRQHAREESTRQEERDRQQREQAQRQTENQRRQQEEARLQEERERQQGEEAEYRRVAIEKAQKAKALRRRRRLLLLVGLAGAVVAIFLVLLRIIDNSGADSQTDCRNGTKAFFVDLQPRLKQLLSAMDSQSISITEAAPAVTAFMQASGEIRRLPAPPVCAQPALSTLLNGLDRYSTAILNAMNGQGTVIDFDDEQNRTYMEIQTGLGQLKALAEGSPTPTPAYKDVMPLPTLYALPQTP